MLVTQIGKYYFPVVGGIESHVQKFSESLVRQHNVRVTVLAANTRNEHAFQRVNGVAVHYLARPLEVMSAPITRGLAHILRRIRSDVVHIHLPNPSAVVAYLIAGLETGLVITWHSDIVRQRLAARFVDPSVTALLRKADAVVATSPQYMAISPHLQKFSTKCTVIPDGVDSQHYALTSSIRRSAARLRARFTGPIVLFIGRLTYYKGVEYLIRAVRGTSMNLLIVGDGRQSRPLRLKAAGIQNIEFLGTVPDVRPYLHACDVLVLPSVAKSEAFGSVLLEAMACAKPVVATKLGTGVEHVVADGKTGFLVPPRSSASLRSALLQLMASLALRRVMGQAGRQRVSTEFSLAAQATKLHCVYARIQEQTARRGQGEHKKAPQ